MRFQVLKIMSLFHSTNTMVLVYSFSVKDYDAVLSWTTQDSCGALF